jgi:hypothetical protein
MRASTLRRGHSVLNRIDRSGKSVQMASVASFVSPPGEIRWRASSFARRPWLTIALHLPCDGRLRAESANLPGSRAKPIGAK